MKHLFTVCFTQDTAVGHQGNSLLFLFFFWFFETGFLCVALAVLELTHRHPSASASGVMGLKTHVTTPSMLHIRSC